MIISDSTTLIILSDLDRFDLLENLFSQVIIPQTVYKEVCHNTEVNFPSFFKVVDVVDILVDAPQSNKLLDDLLLLLDRGECEAIILAKYYQCPLIIDEKKGRTIALNLQIDIIGLLGIILLNVKNAYMDKDEAKLFLQQSIDHGYRISQKLISALFLAITKID